MPSRDAVRLAVIAATAILTSTGAFGAELREEVTRSFDRTVAITGTPTPRVEHRKGEVGIRGHAGNELQVRATIHVSAGSRAEAADLADRIVIDIQSGAMIVAVVTRYPFFRGQNRDLSYSVDYDFLV